MEANIFQSNFYRMVLKTRCNSYSLGYISLSAIVLCSLEHMLGMYDSKHEKELVLGVVIVIP